MTGDEVRALREKYPTHDLDALLGMEKEELTEMLYACRLMYRHNGPGRPSRAKNIHTRDESIYEVLALRHGFMQMDEHARAQIVIGGPDI